MLNDNEIRCILSSPEFLKKLERACFKSAGGSATDHRSDAIIRILSNLDKFDRSRPFVPWALTVAKNAARNAWRADESRDEVTHANTEDGPVSILDDIGDHSVSRADDALSVRRALAGMERDERTFIVALMLGGTQQEAGEAVGWTAVQASRRRPEIEARFRSLLDG